MGRIAIVMVLLAASSWLGACAVAGQGGPSPGETGFTRLEIPLIAEGKPDPSDSAVAGYLFEPKGRGPFPAVIILHGCNGLDWSVRGKPGWALLKGYAKRYRDRGYVALVLDSFEPRGVGNICGQSRKVSPVRRAWDAFSAARYLVALGMVDKDRLVLQGDSHGGWTTLVALERGKWRLPEHFAAAVAWYPYCYRAPGFTAPLLILIGGKDDWTPAPRCIEMTERLRGQAGGSAVELKLFSDATHAYDFPMRPHRNALGHFVAYDAEATAASWRAIDTFLAVHLR